MADVENIILEQLRLVRNDIADMRRQFHQDLQDLTARMGNVETELAGVHLKIAEQSGRIDRMNSRLERVERRLELVTPPVDDGPEAAGQHKNA